MGGMVKGKSDPYVKINIEGVSFKSHVIKENLNPTWNEMYEVNNRGLFIERANYIKCILAFVLGMKNLWFKYCVLSDFTVSNLGFDFVFERWF